MASDEFVAAVATEIQRISKSAAECSRLGLAAEIATQWQGYFSQDAAEVIENVRAAARETGIQLDNYDPRYARGAAEMILSMLEAFRLRGAAVIKDSVRAGGMHPHGACVKNRGPEAEAELAPLRNTRNPESARRDRGQCPPST
jgi:hypothetical protein